MSKVTLGGNPIDVAGRFPQAGDAAPAFKLTGADLADVGLDAFAGKRKVLNIVPSLDTPVCATSTRKFNEEAGKIANTVVLVVSADLPFAAKRFCETESLKNVQTLSTFRNPQFGEAYGVAITSGPLAGVTARAVVVVDANDKVVYSQLVPEIKEEPDYAAALAALKYAAARRTRTGLAWMCHARPVVRQALRIGAAGRCSAVAARRSGCRPRAGRCPGLARPAAPWSRRGPAARAACIRPW